MSVATVESLLRTLKLTTAANELSDVLSKSKSNASLGWVINLLQIEIDNRKERYLHNKIKRSGLPELKSLDSFDWNFNPNINREKIDSISSLNFVKDRGINLFLGQPGTGKSHIAKAIGLKAILEGYNIYWSGLKKLSEDIIKAKRRDELPRLFKKVLSSDLWILDDWAVISLNRDVSEEVFDLLDRRRNNTAMILTSNRDINEWPQVFVDQVLASAAIDRIFDRANVMIFTGRSYRAEGKKEKRIENLDELRV
jgi:DNA replication protein DnaC